MHAGTTTYILYYDYIGDWALQRSGAITLEGTEGFTVRDALFERIDGNGVMLNGAIVGYTRSVASVGVKRRDGIDRLQSQRHHRVLGVRVGGRDLCGELGVLLAVLQRQLLLPAAVARGARRSGRRAAKGNARAQQPVPRNGHLPETGVGVLSRTPDSSRTPPSITRLWPTARPSSSLMSVCGDPGKEWPIRNCGKCRLQRCGSSGWFCDWDPPTQRLFLSTYIWKLTHVVTGPRAMYNFVSATYTAP